MDLGIIMGYSLIESYYQILDGSDNGKSWHKKRVVSLSRHGRPHQFDWEGGSAKKGRVYRGFLIDDDDRFKLGCCRKISRKPHVMCKVKAALRRMNKAMLSSI